MRVYFMRNSTRCPRNCYHCGYYTEDTDEGDIGYCNDLDCEVDPDDPICSDEYYES